MSAKKYSSFVNENSHTSFKFGLFYTEVARKKNSRINVTVQNKWPLCFQKHCQLHVVYDIWEAMFTSA